MDFGRYLKEVRIKKGLSMRELSRRSGVSQAYISQLESGKKGTPTPEQLFKLAPCLDIDYMDLMKAAGYVMEDSDFTEEELAFLKDIEEGKPLIELIKHKPTIDHREVTKEELEIAVDLIRSLRKREGT